MPKLPQVAGSQLIRALEKAGFRVTRQRGSHAQLRREEADGSVTTFPVPVHSGQLLKKGLIRGILRKASLTPDQLNELLRK